MIEDKAERGQGKDANLTMPTSQWRKVVVPGARWKEACRSPNVTSKSDKEQMSSHQPQINGDTPISTITNRDT